MASTHQPREYDTEVSVLDSIPEIKEKIQKEKRRFLGRSVHGE
jgi:hypothetical protein